MLDPDPLPTATIIFPSTTPAGGGSRDIEVIRDGAIDLGDPGRDQYDTYAGSPEEHEDFYGYVFEGKAKVAAVTFTEGRHYENGGWFKDGTLRVQVLINDEWQDVDVSVSPDYPIANDLGSFGGDYETYTFTFTNATVCGGVRIIGMGGGYAHFTSISELTVEVE